MRWGALGLLAVLTMPLAADVDRGSPYDGYHEVNLAVAATNTVFLWLPLLVPRTWVALAPETVTLTLEPPGLWRVERATVVFVEDIAGSQGPWVRWAEGRSPLVLDGTRRAEARVLRGVYRLTRTDGGRPSPVSLTVTSTVLLSGVCAATTLKELQALADPSD